MLAVHAKVAPDAARLAALERELAALQTLEDLLRWGLACSPPREIVAIVVQDEYCHDVVTTGPAQLYLCFDTT